VHVRIIKTLPAISAIFAMLILGCRGAAQEQPAVEPHDGSILVRVLDHGGPCADGRECAVQTDVLADGSLIHRLSFGSVTTYQVDTDRVQQLIGLITATDFTTLRSQPFTGTCPTASDGTERLYTFTTAVGPETLAGCEVEIDHIASLIALVDEIVGLASLDGTSSTVLPAPTAAVGHLEGRATIGPLQPVERVGVPPPTPSPAACTARGLIVYAADSGAEVVRFSFGPDCTYRAELAPGNYRVELDRRGIDISKNLPQNVTITNGQVTRLDVCIDTGIR
jgi:hypothetical protein